MTFKALPEFIEFIGLRRHRAQHGATGLLESTWLLELEELLEFVELGMVIGLLELAELLESTGLLELEELLGLIESVQSSGQA